MLPTQEAARLVHECLGLLDPRQREVWNWSFLKN